MSQDMARLRGDAAPQHKAAARAVFEALVIGEFRDLGAELRRHLTRVELDLLAEAVADAINPARRAWPTDTAWRTAWATACAEYHRDRVRREGAV